MSQKIRFTIEIVYEPDKNHYQLYDKPPETIYEMAAIDRDLLLSGELTVGDFNEDALKVEWEVINRPDEPESKDQVGREGSEWD